MKPFLLLLAVMLAAWSAGAQNCTTLQPLTGGSPPGVLSLGIAVAVVPSADREQQEKAPPDSVFVDVQPVLRKKAEPVYPKLAMAAGIEGKVFLRLWVDAEGKVHDVKVIKTDHEVLNQSAIDAARQFEFAPASVNGKPVSIWVTVPFKFKLADKTDGADIKGLPVGLQGAIGCIVSLLTEKDVAKCKPSITPDAYAVIGSHYVPLVDAIERRGTPKGLPDERGWELSLVHTVMDDGAQLATLLLRTVNKKTGAFRFHTVVCVRSRDGEWRIRHWHAGQ
jgi:TonB family protein